MQKSLFFYDFHFMERNQMVHDIASTDEKKYQKTKKIPYGIFFQTVDKVRDIRCGLFSRKELKSQYLQARL